MRLHNFSIYPTRQTFQNSLCHPGAYPALAGGAIGPRSLTEIPRDSIGLRPPE
jgi:hypothetical protein